MAVQPHDYYPPGEWDAIRDLASRHETPCLIVDLPAIRRKYDEFQSLFPFAKHHYAVKANPSPEIVTLLWNLGCNFDVASIYELDSLLDLGISPNRMSYGNTIKKASDIRYAYEHGVRLFATDSLSDVKNLAKEAPQSDVFFRILTSGGETADWPLSRKFGCHPDTLVQAMLLAKELGLNVRGVSFHVGSQQRDVGAWASAITKVRYIFDWMSKEGVTLDLVNMGGGIPARYTSEIPDPHTCAEEITRTLTETFGELSQWPKIIMEPGRSLVAEAGVLVSEVVLITRKSIQGMEKWLYTDAGVFNGLIETLGESIQYPVWCEAKGEDDQSFILAGPTCDSLDLMYERYRVPLPSEIGEGDRLYWLSAGAYTASYCSVGFNGFPPLKTYFVKD